MKCFTRLFALFLIAAPFLQSCTIQMNDSSGSFLGGSPIKGNSTIVNKEIPISDYTKIEVNGIANVIYQQISEETPYLQVNVDENIFPLLDIHVENGRLTIQTKDNKNIKPTKFTIYTNSKELYQATLSGAGDLYLKGEVNSKDMKINISGSGNLKTDSLYCEKLNLGISGAGDAKMAGASNYASFSISGAGDVNAFDYFVQNLSCNVSGAGDIEVSAGEKLNVNVSGVGDVKYKGNPQIIDKKISGVGSVSKVS